MEGFPNGTEFFNVSVETKWSVLPNASYDILSNDTNISEFVQSYENIPMGTLLLILFLLPFGMVLNVFIIIYERFEMDSMKRGLFHQVSCI